jgi:hypothetical protein
MPPLTTGKSRKTWHIAYCLQWSMGERKSQTSRALGPPPLLALVATCCPGFHIRSFTGFVVMRYKSSQSLITRGSRDIGGAVFEINSPAYTGRLDSNPFVGAKRLP